MLPPKAYKVYITRRQDWFDKKNYNAIPLDEWTSYVKSDFQMLLINGWDLKVCGKMYSYRNKGLSIWKFHIYKGEPVFEVFFDYANGNIEVNNPDEETIKKMVAIAGRLNAKVQGAKGECYDETFYANNILVKPWWKFW